MYKRNINDKCKTFHRKYFKKQFIDTKAFVFILYVICSKRNTIFCPIQLSIKRQEAFKIFPLHFNINIFH